MTKNSKIAERIVNEAKNLQEYIVHMRREFHKIPELMFEEHKTRQLIVDELKKMGYENIQRTAKTGVIATLKGSQPGKVVALRADMDALKIQEQSDKPYKSQHAGKMHACGHDTHMAMLLGAAKIIIAQKNTVRGTVKLIFQPGEEGGAGGKLIVEDGHLDDVDVIYGIHIWCDEECTSGDINTNVGGLMASADEFKITIKGKGGHAASPHETRDPTSVLIDIYDALQKIVSREIDPLERRVITTPQIKGSDAHNVIPDVASLTGTFRTMNPKVREFILKRMRELVEGYAKAWRCEGRIDLIGTPYPPLINSEAAIQPFNEILQNAQLDFATDVSSKTMGGEDFAFYTNKVKGAFIFLGTYNEEKGITAPHHHPQFDVDESILWKGTAVYALLGLLYSKYK